MSGKSDWNIVTNKKKNKSNKIDSSLINSNDPIISRRVEAQKKFEADKKEYKQIKYGQQKDPNQDWNYTTLSKTKPNQNVKLHIPYTQKYSTSVKENADGDVKIKKISKSMAKAIVDARVAKNWTQVQLARNSAVDTKTINEIEKGGGVYNSNIFNKLCKTLGVNIERKFDLV